MDEQYIPGAVGGRFWVAAAVAAWTVVGVFWLSFVTTRARRGLWQARWWARIKASSGGAETAGS